MFSITILRHFGGLLQKYERTFRIVRMTSDEIKETVFTVKELTLLVKDLIEGTFPSVTLEGEISNCRPNASGHLYFTLKDNEAQISAVMFRSRASQLAFVPKDGMKVRAKGSLSVYQARGNYQIIVSSMTASGEGDILQMLEERKRKLAAEGLFDSERKRALSRFPRTIGIITSATGAALHDILNITHRRNRSINIVILPAVVQGDDAPKTIIKQIRLANHFALCDVLIVGRGGGSLEDLLPFSDEGVVRAVAASKIPVVSAVGHEIDWAISDFAADVRAPTPSAAAELVTPIKADIEEQIRFLKDDLYQSIKAKTERAKILVESFDTQHLELLFRAIEQPLLSRLDSARSELESAMKARVESVRAAVEKNAQVLESCNPENILARGYSVVREKNSGKIVRNAAEIPLGTVLEIIPKHGKLNATVTGE